MSSFSRAAGRAGDQGVEFALVAENAEEDVGGQAGVARIEMRGFGGERFGGPGASVDREESGKGGISGGGDGHHSSRTGAVANGAGAGAARVAGMPIPPHKT